jgi:hypothetical protein
MVIVQDLTQLCHYNSEFSNGIILPNRRIVKIYGGLELSGDFKRNGIGCVIK